SVNVFETIGTCGQKGSGLLRDVGRMIVQNEPNGAVRRVGGVEVLQQGDKLPAAMTPLDVRRYMTGMQVKGRQDGASPQAFILVVTGQSRVPARHRRQVGSRRGEGLHSRLLVHRNRDDF